jgi:hypothetical protein
LTVHCTVPSTASTAPWESSVWGMILFLLIIVIGVLLMDNTGKELGH